MSDKWYNDPNCDWFYEEREQKSKRRRILRRRIRSACNVVIGICLLMILGILGSADIGEISLTEVFTYEAISIGILVVSTFIRTNV